MTVTVGEITYTVGMEFENMLESQKQINTRLDQMEARFNKSAKSADQLESSMNKLASAIKLVIASSALREMAGMVQRFQEMSERVQMATSSQQEFEHVQQRLLKTANGTYRALSEAQELYITTADSLRSMNYTTDQAIDIQDSMSYAFVKNATSADRANGAISAFSKSINKGKVEADSWETIIAAIPSVIGDIAAASGKSSAEIRALGSAGKITAQQLSEGLRQSLEANAAAAAGMSNNLTDASVRMKTAITAVLVEIEKSTGALQGFTNEIISVADAMLDFSSDTDKMPIAINAAAIAAGALGGVLAGRLLTSLASATKGKIETIAASVEQSTADRQLAKDELGAATAIQRRAVVEKEAAIVERQRAVDTLASLKATNASTVAEVAHADAELASIKVNLQQIQAEKALEVQRAKSQITEQGRIATSTRMAQLRQAEAALTQQAARAESVAQNARAVAYESASARIAAANATVATTTAAVRTANGAVAASQERVTATSITMAGALKSVNSALMPLGGVAGVVMMIAAGWYMYAQNQEAARQKNIEFADSLPDLIGRMKELNAVQLQGALGDTAKSITAQQERISELTESVKEAEREYQNYTKRAKELGGVQDQNNGYVKNAMKWFHTLAQRKRDLNDATDRLNATLSQQSLIQEQVNQKARESEEAFNVIANNLRNKIPGASEATITALATTIHFIDQLNKKAAKVSVQPNEPTESPEAKKLIQNAERRLELAKLEGEARARLQAQYDAEDVGYSKDDPYTKKLQDSYAATERETQARKESNAEGKKSASSAESIAQKLANLKQQSEMAASSTKELSREQTMLRAEQSLGSAASESQIKQARDYAAATWDAANAIKVRQQAEQGKKFATQEIAAAQVQEDPLTGLAQDPLAQINLREQQKLDALAKYQEIDKQNTKIYEDAKTAIQQQAANERKRITIDENNERMRNIGSLLGSASDSFGAIASAIQQSGKESSSAYKVMFAASKGFAIAQAGLNLSLAISNALASGPFPWNLAAMAAVGAAGASLISSISGAVYGGGRKNGGGVSAGKVYEFGEGNLPEIWQDGGKNYMLPGNKGKVISNKDIAISKASTGSEYLSASKNQTPSPAGGSKQWNVVVNFIDQTSGGNHTLETRGVQQNEDSLTLDAVLLDIANSGPMSQTMQSTFGLNRRAHGDY